jgi:hypothetical protein
MTKMMGEVIRSKDGTRNDPKNTRGRWLRQVENQFAASGCQPRAVSLAPMSVAIALESSVLSCSRIFFLGHFLKYPQDMKSVIEGAALLA